MQVDKVCERGLKRFKVGERGLLLGRDRASGPYWELLLSFSSFSHVTALGMHLSDNTKAAVFCYFKAKCTFIWPRFHLVLNYADPWHSGDVLG